jgi:hypothetical protein
MAKKERPRAIQLARKPLEKALKELGVVERDLARVRENLRKFLHRGTFRSGPESLDKRHRTILRAMGRRR